MLKIYDERREKRARTNTKVWLGNAFLGVPKYYGN